jgi:Tol biopolymer transport system component
MKFAAIALTLSTMLTVEQRDTRHSMFDHPTSAVSADGRFIAFITFSQLAPADVDSSSDLYVLDRARKHVTLESAGAGDGRLIDSDRPGISRDGRFVVYERNDAILVRDREDGVTKIIGMGNQPFITEDGRTVLFTAGRFDRVAATDVNGARNDIYTVDLRGGEARRVSVDLHGLDESSATSVTPTASADGRYVAFTSRPPFERSDARAARVYVRDTVLNVTKFIGAGWKPWISGNGRFVAFVGTSNRMPHISLADLQTGATRIITNSVRRGLANGASTNPTISSDGRFVAFQSEANDLVAASDFNLLSDIFVFDRATDAITRASGDPEGVWMEPSTGPSIDATGSVLAFSSRHPIDASDKQNDFDLYVATLTTLNTEARRGTGTLNLRVLFILRQRRFRSQRIGTMPIHNAIDPRDEHRDMKIDQQAKRFVE